MKKYSIGILIASLMLMPVYSTVHATATPTGGTQSDIQSGSLSCSGLSTTSTTATFTMTATGSYNLSGTSDVVSVQAAQSNLADAPVLTPTTSSGNSSQQAQYLFSGLTAGSPYSVIAFDSSGSQITAVSGCDFTTATAAATSQTGSTGSPQAATTDDSCTASDVDAPGGYEKCCTGQASQDSLICNDEATMLINENGGIQQCANITSTDVYNQCCGTGSTSGQEDICTAYATRDPADIPQITANQAGGSGTLSTGAVNAVPGVGAATVAASPNDPALQSCSNIKFNTILDIAIWVKCVIGVVIIPGIFSLAFVVFLWGVFKFMRSSEKTDKEEGKRIIFVGLIGLFIMVSVWGIIQIASNTLGIQSVVPTLQTDPLGTSNQQ